MNITPEMVEDLENIAQEVLMDLNSWQSNPSTVMGFAYGRNNYVATSMQDNLDKHGRFAEQIDQELFVSYQEYCKFIANLCNTIPLYNDRFTSCWNEQGPGRLSK